MSNTSLLGSYGGLGESSLMFRNRVINGDMKVWQRATSGAHTGNQVGSYGATLERSIDVPSGRLYSAKAISTAAGIDDFVVGQIIESTNTFDLVGQSVTFSVQMKKLATLTGALVRMEVCYLNTIDTSPTDWLNNGGATVISSRVINSADFATSWSQYTLTTGVLPAQAANGLAVRLILQGSNLGSGDLFAFTDVQLEAGPVATPFERRPIGVELGMCQRYYHRITSSTVFGPIAIGHCTTTTVSNLLITFPVTMRIPPATVDSSAASTFQLSDGTTAITCTSISGSGTQITTNTTYLGATVASGLTLYRPIRLEGANTASAYVGFSAEL
jgi:hypothetical protein